MVKEFQCRRISSFLDSVKGKSSGVDSKVSLKESIKFALPKDFESKRNPVLRKPTVFNPKDSFDDDMDDDDDAVDNEQFLQYGEGSEGAISLRGEGDEGEEEEEEINEEEEDEGVEGETGSSKVATPRSKAMASCTGPSKRKILVYGEYAHFKIYSTLI